MGFAAMNAMGPRSWILLARPLGLDVMEEGFEPSGRFCNLGVSEVKEPRKGLETRSVPQLLRSELAHIVVPSPHLYLPNSPTPVKIG